MSQSTNIDNDICGVKSPCSHRKANLCTFRMWEEAFLETLAVGDPENRTCYQGMIGVLVKPCLELNEEKRKQGIPDIFGLNPER